MTVGRLLRRIFVAAVAAAAIAACLLGAGTRDSVDWRRLRAVVFESDDWGLAGFVPADSAWHGIDREALAPGRFPAVYWGSTLEDSLAVAALAHLFGGTKGADGLPAVLQPNYVLSSLDLQTDGVWRRYDLPRFPPQYDRPGMWEASQSAIAAGVWYPEFHAAWHYDPQRRREQTAQDPLVRAAALRGIMLFPGSERARELGAWRPRPQLEAELDTALALFETAFGRPPGAVIAPDYSWNGRNESIWQSRGLTVIQAKREQRNPGFGSGALYRVRKWADRQWCRVFRPGRTYLERNCRFEPVQFADTAAVAESCRGEIVAAWERGEPAIVETHRINFVHTDPEVAQAGRDALAALLGGLDEDGAEPVYLTDHEVAQLKRRGASWCVRGGVVVLRNPSHGRRVVVVPAAALELAGRQAGSACRSRGPLAVAVPAGAVLKLVPGRDFGPGSSRG